MTTVSRSQVATADLKSQNIFAHLQQVRVTCLFGLQLARETGWREELERRTFLEVNRTYITDTTEKITVTSESFVVHLYYVELTLAAKANMGPAIAYTLII